MNILVIEDHASSEAGGAEQSMRGFLEHIYRSHRVHLVYGRAGDHVTHGSAIYASAAQASVLPLRVQPPVQWARAVTRVARMCRREQIDLIVTHVVHAIPFARVMSFITRTPVHFVFKWVCSTDTVGSQTRWGCRGLDRCVATSQFVADYWIRNGVSAARMTIVPEGVAIPERLRSLPTRINDSTLRVAFGGRIVPGKGLHILVEAVSLLRRRGVRVVCEVMGRFDPSANAYHANLLRQVEELRIQELVNFRGFVSPLVDQLSTVDVVIVPSTCQDAQNLVMMQAMSVGTPVLAARVGGIPSVLDAPFASLLFEPNDPECLAASIERFVTLSTEERGRIGGELAQRIRESYDVRSAHERLASALSIPLINARTPG
jgi:glycosyltransferase involved in cell wall biosynthesis